MNHGPPVPAGAGRGAGGPTLAPGAARPLGRDTGSAPGRVFRVVVVDDTPDLRDLLTVVLNRAPDFEVVGHAGDGREGIDLLRRERPDVVLLDLAMPVMSGLEALPRMRGLVPEAAVVVLSGFGAEAMARQALDAGADAYVEKGTPAPRIVARIREVLGAAAPVAAAPARRPASSGRPAPAREPGDEHAPAGDANRPPAAGGALPPTEEVQLLRRAVATTAHEIRNPVMVLRWALQALAGDDPDLPPESRDGLVASAHRQLRQLDIMCADLLTATQANREDVQLAPETFDLLCLLRDLVTEQPGVTLVCDEPRLWVHADRSRIEQVVVNLLANATKYGAPPVELRARATTRARVEIAVADRGPGVPTEFRPRLFDEFARSDGVARAGGNGLGLFVAARIARAHGGRARYDDHPGGGAVFTVDVPAAS